MITRFLPTDRIDFAQAARRGLAAAALAAVLAGVALPAQAAGCGSEPIDRDGDGITCYDEVTLYGTDPFLYDTDGDSYSDSYELYTLGTNPLVFTVDPLIVQPGPAGYADSDFDGLSDANELTLHGTDPYNADTDFDGLSDGAEWLYPSNPLFPDTDGDGVADGVEYQAGTDLLDPASFPVNPIGVG